MDKGSGRRRVRVKLKSISFFNNAENPFISGYLAPLVDEEG